MQAIIQFQFYIFSSRVIFTILNLNSQSEDENGVIFAQSFIIDLFAMYLILWIVLFNWDSFLPIYFPTTGMWGSVQRLSIINHYF